MAYDSILEIYGGVPFDPRYEHSVSFSNANAQRSFFNSKMKHIFTDFSYLRTERSVKVPLNLEDMEDADLNYCGMRNGTKWRYFFIVRKEYVSDQVTRIYLDLDVLQTYQFDWTLPACFVEREHVANDNAGEHLIDEGLETGEFVSRLNYSLQDIGTNWAVVIQSSVNLTADFIGDDTVGGIYNQVYSGLKIYAIEATLEGSTTLNSTLEQLSRIGVADGVVAMWMYPQALLNVSGGFGSAIIKPVLEVRTLAAARGARTNLDGYTPRNRKLYCYPYSFLYLHNNCGEGATYKYEYFDGTDIDRPITFEYTGNLSPDAAIRIFPRNYRGMIGDYESGLTLQNFPSCAWTQDAYLIWMAQNQNQQNFAIQGAAVQGAIGAAQIGAGGVQAAVTLGHETDLLTSGLQHAYSAYQTIGGLMAQRQDRQIQPPQSRGTQSATVNATVKIHTFTFCDMSVDSYHAQQIDEFFDMYGYKVNRVKVPQYSSRPLWNYIKTVGCVVKGDFDAGHRRRIAEIFDKGVTFWHTTDGMYNYSNAANNTANSGVG